MIARVRDGDQDAWSELIARYEGRLLAFATSRLNGDRAKAEDVVQEAFVGFVTSLPNYDEKTPLESFLFAITAHKLTDQLRRDGRRPAKSLFATVADWVRGAGVEDRIAGNARRASSIAMSREGKSLERDFVAAVLEGLVRRWRERGEWERLACADLLFGARLANKRVAEILGISEQAVANHKAFVVGKLREAASRAGMRAGG
ncbi:MAG: sigma-70 family RNA polymerase sigma factor [Planctomycetota bacterium]